MPKERNHGKDKISIQRLLLLIAAAVALLILLLTLFLTMCTKTALTFEVDGEVYVTVNATGEETLTLPEEPEKDGYVFDGWYWDKDIWEQPFTGDTPVTGNGKLYAKWKEAHEHSYGEWEVVTPATCTAEGLQKRVCSCGAEETEVIPTVAHNYETKFDATNHWEECSVCHEKINETAHSFGAWEVVTAASCTAEGLQKHVCACGAEETEAIQKLAHTYGDWTVTPATCTSEGQKNHTCSVCGTEETAVIPKLPHTNTTKYDETNHWQECSVCGETSNPEAHTYENGLCTVCKKVYGTEGLMYRKITNGYAVSGIGSAGNNAEIIIPSWHEGEPVTAIDSRAFRACRKFARIEIPHSVTSIGSYAFSGCSSLETITVAEGNTKYKSAGNCIIETATKTLIAGCKASVIPTDGSVTSIGSSAFDECSNLTSITIPDSVTSIGFSAFNGCSSLTSIVMGNGVTSIGHQAFYRCGSLAGIAVPNSVTSIGDQAFDGSGIWNNAAENSVVYADKWAIGYKGDKSTLSGALTLNADTVGIGESAFSACTGLQSIVIPDCVRNISENAFYGCNSLQSITIPFVGAARDGASDTHFGYIFGASRYSSSAIPAALKEVIITGGTSIAGNAFSGCTNIQSIVIRNGVTSIGSSAFEGCSGLQSIAIGNSVTSIGDSAFYGCSSLSGIEYQGTKAQWNGITKGRAWNYDTGEYTVTCTDGTLMKAES